MVETSLAVLTGCDVEHFTTATTAGDRDMAITVESWISLTHTFHFRFICQQPLRFPSQPPLLLTRQTHICLRIGSVDVH